MPYNNKWTLSMWKDEVKYDKTLLGYYTWVSHMKSRDKGD